MALSDNNLVLAPSNATVGMRLTSDGLCFGSDTATANALNDYEEGTWTATFAGSSSTATGYYVNLVDGSVFVTVYGNPNVTISVTGTVRWPAVY